MARAKQPQQEWYRPFAVDDPKSDFWQADVSTPAGEYRLTVTTTDTGLYPGGRWSWVMKSPRGWETASDRGFRSERSAKLAAEEYLVRVVADAVVRASFKNNPGDAVTESELTKRLKF